MSKVISRPRGQLSTWTTIEQVMRSAFFYMLLGLMIPVAFAQTIPTFTGSFETNGKQYSYTMAGQKPESGATTTIQTILVPLTFTFEAAHKEVMDARSEVRDVLRSPIFQNYAFVTGNTQYGDAVQRAQFYKTVQTSGWHTLLGQPQLASPIRIEIPVANGYVLRSKRTGKSLAVADLDCVQKQIFEHLASIGAESDKLVIAIAKNVAFYSLGDATVCCSVGAHGTQAGKAFIIGSYFEKGVMPRYTDVQAISQQVAEWMNDPLHGDRANEFPGWLNPPANKRCGGRG